MMERQTIVVIGGGISGLAVAYELIERAERQPRPVDVLCLEASSRPGGNIRTEREGGFLCEWAANGFLDAAPTTLTLVRRLGLAERLVRADEASARRYILRAGRLRKVPTTPGAFLRSDVLSWPGKLRVLCEPLVRARRDAQDETVHDFAARRIGVEAAAVLVDAMVAGIYAGDSKRLSLAATFPRMRAMEAEHGGLFRAMLARRRKSVDADATVEETAGGPAGPAGWLTSFREGMQELTDGLARALGDRLRLGAPVERVSDLGQRGLRVHPRSGAPLDVDAVVLACPATAAAGIVSDMDADLAAMLRTIASSPLAVAHLGFRRDALGSGADGFGFLVPRGEGRRILGALWSSNLFPGRAPANSLLATVMVGGAHDPDAVTLREDKLLAIALGELSAILGAQAKPWFTRVLRHPGGIPQYGLDHVERVAAIEKRAASHAGLRVTGNAYHGVALNACIERAPALAEELLELLAGRAEAGAMDRRPG